MTFYLAKTLRVLFVLQLDFVGFTLVCSNTEKVLGKREEMFDRQNHLALGCVEPQLLKECIT